MGSVERQPYREERRKGVAWLLIGMANTLENINTSTWQRMLEDEDDYNSFTGREIAIIQRVEKYTRWQIRALRVLAKEMGVKHVG